MSSLSLQIRPPRRLCSAPQDPLPLVPISLRRLKCEPRRELRTRNHERGTGNYAPPRREPERSPGISPSASPSPLYCVVSIELAQVRVLTLDHGRLSVDPPTLLNRQLCAPHGPPKLSLTSSDSRRLKFEIRTGLRTTNDELRTTRFHSRCRCQNRISGATQLEEAGRQNSRTHRTTQQPLRTTRTHRTAWPVDAVCPSGVRRFHSSPSWICGSIITNMRRLHHTYGGRPCICGTSIMHMGNDHAAPPCARALRQHRAPCICAPHVHLHPAPCTQRALDA